MAAEQEPYTEDLSAFVYPLEAGVVSIFISSVLYLLVVPSIVAYGYAVALGRSVARDEEPAKITRDGLASDVFPLLSLKLFLFLFWFFPMYVVEFSPTWAVIVYSLPFVYFNGALNAVYAAEGSPLKLGRVVRLILSPHYLRFNMLYAPVAGAVAVVAVIATRVHWLLLLLLSTYWVMASFSYRGWVYKSALESGVFEGDPKEIKEGWRNESESREEQQAETEATRASAAGPASVCPDCGNEVVREATFCNLCGSELLLTEDTSKESGDEDSISCPDCGQELLREDSYCWNCGAEVAVTDKTRKGGEMSEEGVCDDCGTELKEGASFCQNCGEEVGAQEPERRMEEKVSGDYEREEEGWLLAVLLVAGVLVVIYVLLVLI